MTNILLQYPIQRTTISSTLFVTNIIHLYGKDNDWYFYSFVWLLIMSILYHQTKNKYVSIADKIGIVSVVYHGGTNLFVSYPYDVYTMIVIAQFCSVFWLYHYGYRRQKYIFDKNETTGDNYHMLLHVISSTAHHIIIHKM